MFGFGKKRKVRNQFESFLDAVLGTYMLMRSVGSFKMEEANLDPLALQMFEISYILGVIDALAHAVDLDGKIIGEEGITDTCIGFCDGAEIFGDVDAGGILYGAMALKEEGNPIHKLMYLGANDARTCVNAMLDGKDPSEASRAMGLSYFDDKDLIEDFKQLFETKIGKSSE